MRKFEKSKLLREEHRVRLSLFTKQICMRIENLQIFYISSAEFEKVPRGWIEELFCKYDL